MAKKTEISKPLGSEGLIGFKVDPTPNENYTLAGVVEGLPTPETDKDAKKAAEKQVEEIAKKL